MRGPLACFMFEMQLPMDPARLDRRDGSPVYQVLRTRDRARPW